MSFVPIRGYTAPGRYPTNENTARHLYRSAATNGLSAAFVKIGGRVLIDPDIIQSLLAAQARGDVPSRLLKKALATMNSVIIHSSSTCFIAVSIVGIGS